MASIIRLRRVGTKSKPYFQMVVCEKRLKRNGKVKEILGVFDPFHPEQKKINQELVDLWLKRGAQISPKCQKILR